MPVSAARQAAKDPVRASFEAFIHGAARFSVQQLGVTLYLVEVTPEKANAVLEHCNMDNRRVRQTKVAEYSRYMKRGDWMVRGTIEFLDSGRLHDGQHRLLAVVDSGVPSKFLVQVLPEQVAAKASQFTDIGVSRNLGDYLHFHGVYDAYRTAALLQYEKNARISAGNPFQGATYERKEYLDLYREIGERPIRLAYDITPSALWRKLNVQRAFADWFAYTTCQIDSDAAALFLQYVAEPSQLKASNPMFVLHERLIEVAQKPPGLIKRKGSISYVETGVMFIKAWNLHYEHQPATPSKLRYRVTESFPELKGSRV